jgi:hypothetical protein
MMDTYQEALATVLRKCREARDLNRIWIEVQEMDNWRGYKLISTHKRHKGEERVVVQDLGGDIQVWAKEIVAEMVVLGVCEPELARAA